MVVVYNNINFKNTKCDKLLGHIFIMRSLMIIVIIYCFKLPSLGLYWLIYNLTIPLNVKDIYCYGTGGKRWNLVGLESRDKRIVQNFCHILPRCHWLACYYRLGGLLDI